VNCVLQNPRRRSLLTADDLSLLAPGSLIVDVSCDEGMGFECARPTTFDEPTFVVGDHVTYYGVDHSPSYLWTAQLERSARPLLRTCASSRRAVCVALLRARRADETVRRAIEIATAHSAPGHPVVPAPFGE
jgi:alanine dehydrogenase